MNQKPCELAPGLVEICIYQSYTRGEQEPREEELLAGGTSDLEALCL